MKSIPAYVFLSVAVLGSGPGTAADTLPASLTGPAVLDYWGTQFTSLRTMVPENPFRTRCARRSRIWRCSTP